MIFHEPLRWCRSEHLSAASTEHHYHLSSRRSSKQASRQFPSHRMRKCVCWAWSCTECKQHEKKESKSIQHLLLLSYLDSFASRSKNGKLRKANQQWNFMALRFIHRRCNGSLIWKLSDSSIKAADRLERNLNCDWNNVGLKMKVFSVYANCRFSPSKEL